MTAKQRWVLVLSSLASLMVALDALVVSTALEAIHRHLGASIDELEWTVNAYGLSFAVLLIPAAALGDRLGRRRLFAAGLGLFVLGSAACALSPNAGLLIAARAVQGSAAALVAPLSLALVSAAFPPEQPRPGDGHLRRHHRPGGAQRAGDRRRRDPGAGLAMGVLDQRPDRPGRRSRSCWARSGRATARAPGWTRLGCCW